MEDTDRFRLLFGPYRTPRFRISSLARCVVRGEVRIVGVSDTPIPWPVCRVGTGREASDRWAGDQRPVPERLQGTPNRLYVRGVGCTAGSFVAREAFPRAGRKVHRG